jgi:hypothetical protein
MKMAECDLDDISVQTLVQLERVVTLKENVDYSEYDHSEKLEEGKDVESSPHDWSPVLVSVDSEWSLSFG